MSAPERWESVGSVVRTVRAADGTGGFEVATVAMHRDDRHEVAQLIAEAFAMLDMLRAVLAEVGGDERPFDGDSYLPPHMVEALRRLVVAGAALKNDWSTR